MSCDFFLHLLLVFVIVNSEGDCSIALSRSTHPPGLKHFFNKKQETKVQGKVELTKQIDDVYNDYDFCEAFVTE